MKDFSYIGRRVGQECDRQDHLPLGGMKGCLIMQMTTSSLWWMEKAHMTDYLLCAYQ